MGDTGQTDERDLLIGGDRGSRSGKGAGRAKGKRFREANNGSNHEAGAAASGGMTRDGQQADYEQTTKGQPLLARLFSFITPTASTAHQTSASPHHHHHHLNYSYLYGGPTAADQSHVTLSADDEQVEVGGAHKSGHYADSDYDSNNHNNHKQQDRTHHLLLAQRQRCRLLVTFLLTALLLAASLLLLAKLLSLVQDYRHFSELSVLQSVGGAVSRSWLAGGDSDDDNSIDKRQLELGKKSRWLVASPKCHIPNLNAWDPTIREEIEVKPALDCKKMYLEHHHGDTMTLEAALTYVRDNKLYLSKEALAGGVLKKQQCCYRQITRGTDDDDELVYDESCTTLRENGFKPPHELIEVRCHAHNYTNIHSFIQRQEEEEEALGRVEREKLLKDQYYNVVILGVDTMSRLNGIRQLSKTLSVLRTLYHKLDFHGYNKVGENTFPNLIPFLTGLTPEQLTETRCWMPSNYSQESEMGDDYLDNCKYLWNYYQELGYVTYFSEDWAKASTFNYLKKGFHMEPTTYYGRPFDVAREPLLLPPVNMGCQSCQLDEPIVSVDLERLKSFLKSHQNRPHFAFHWINCPQHDDLNGASQFDQLMANFLTDIHPLVKQRTMFIFFSDHGYRWNPFVSTRLGHYESSLPLMTWSPPQQFMDKHRQLYENMRLHEHTLLTPFDMFKSLVALKELATNKEAISKKVKATMEPLDKDEDDDDDDDESKKKQVSTNLPPHKVDYLAFTAVPTAATIIRQLEPMNGLTYRQKFQVLSVLEANEARKLDRSCLEAGIPDNYCVCHEFEPTPVERADVVGAALYLVYVHLYERLAPQRRLCHLLDLDKVTWAEEFDFKNMRAPVGERSGRRKRAAARVLSTTAPPPAAPAERQEEEEEEPFDDQDAVSDEAFRLPNREYNIRFITKPGGALFQEVVRFYGKDMEACRRQVEEARLALADHQDNFRAKHARIKQMNQVCRFSVHSDSISRLNLYGDQSKCVKSNIELKKVCLCRDLSV